jgi:hypothetical protein
VLQVEVEAPRQRLRNRIDRAPDRVAHHAWIEVAELERMSYNTPLLRSLAVITALVGITFLVSATVQTILAFTLSTAAFVGTTQVVRWIVYGAGAVPIVWYVRRHPFRRAPEPDGDRAGPWLPQRGRRLRLSHQDQRKRRRCDKNVAARVRRFLMSPTSDRDLYIELLDEVMSWLTGLGLITFVIFPLALPLIALTLLVAIPLLLAAIPLAILAAPMLLIRRALRPRREEPASPLARLSTPRAA